MEVSGIIDRAHTVASVRGDDAADADAIKTALRAAAEIVSWATSSRTALTAQLSEQVSFPEKAAADCTRGSTRDAIKDKERSDTLDNTPELAEAFDDATVTAGHVDALTNTAKNLDNDEQRNELFDRVADLVDVASVASIEQWRRRLGIEAKNIRRGDGIDRLERQRRDTRVRTWTDGDGMVCISGRFDPVTGRAILARLDHAVEALFAEHTPDTCPTDPIGKQHHLHGLALARLVTGDTDAAGRPGRPEYVVVIDTTETDGAGGPAVDWGIPVEIPHRVLADMIGDGNVHAVVVRNGIVLHAPGELNLGRTTRLANQAQRRALRALYSTCAIPGCSVTFDRCKIHHIIWWRNGGRTDLHNLLPVCTHHHTKIHDHRWDITLGPNRELTIRLPDSTIHNTGPPKRTAA
jgi:hypothetical protein